MPGTVNGLVFKVSGFGQGAAKRLQNVCKVYGTDMGLRRDRTRCGVDVKTCDRGVNDAHGMVRTAPMPLRFL